MSCEEGLYSVIHRIIEYSAICIGLSAYTLNFVVYPINQTITILWCVFYKTILVTIFTRLDICLPTMGHSLDN